LQRNTVTSAGKKKSQDFRASFASAQQPIKPEYYSEQMLEGLPAPVQKYFKVVLKDGQRLLAGGSISTEGDFLFGAEKGKWIPFVATQMFTANPPAFDWNARMTMMPGISVLVQDAYAKGEGILHATMFGLIDLANIRGTTDAAQGELMRYLAETLWMPTALLPGQNIRWEAIDDRKARAILTDGSVSVSLEFRFNSEGLIESVWSAARAHCRQRIDSGTMAWTILELSTAGRNARAAWRRGGMVVTVRPAALLAR
jgi:hypothetical protein